MTCRYTNLEGEWVDETVYGGSCVYLPNGRVTVFMRTSELAFGYTGRYEFDNGKVTTYFEAASEPSLEGTSWVRQFQFEGNDRFHAITVDPATAQKVATVWERRKA